MQDKAFAKRKDAGQHTGAIRIIGGQIAPDIVDVVMVRRAPQPGAPGASASPAPAATRPATAVEAPK